MRRLSRTRSTWSGAQSAWCRRGRAATLELHAACARFGLEARSRHDSTSRRERARSGARARALPRRSGRARRGRRRAAPSRRAWSRSGPMYSSAPRRRRRSPRASPRSKRSACGGRGLRRRRARGGRRRGARGSAAISLNARPSSASSRGPVTGARTPRSPAATCAEASRSRSMRVAIEAPSARLAATAADAAAAATARILTSSPMWNMTQPERSTTASGSSTARSASPISWSRTVGRSRSATVAASPAASVSSVTTSANSITARTGSRRPRPSRGAAGWAGSALDLRPETAHVHGQRSGVEGGFVAPHARHQLAAREDLARVRGEEVEKVELLHGQAQALAVPYGLPRSPGRGVRSSNVDAARVPPRAAASAGAPPSRASQLARRERFRDVVVGALLEARRSGRPRPRARSA